MISPIGIFVDRAVRPARMRPTVRDLRDELEELSVALGHTVVRSSRKKSFSQESNRPLDPAFLLRFSNPAKPRLYVHHTGDVENPRMKANGVAVTLDNDGLRIVEEPLTRSSTKIAARAHQRASQANAPTNRARTLPTWPGSRRAPSRRPKARAFRPESRDTLSTRHTVTRSARHEGGRL